MKVFAVVAVFGLATLGAFFGPSGMAQTAATPTLTPFLPDFSETVPADIPVVYVQESILEGNWQVEVENVEELIVAAAGTQPDVDDPALISAVAVQESGGWYNCPDGPISASCTGGAGEIGPMQIKEFHFTEDEDPRDLLTNFTVGARVLQRDGFDNNPGNVRLALAAYHCGPYGDYATNQDCLDYADSVREIYKNATGHYPSTN